jgi:hypothetical protein
MDRNKLNLAVDIAAFLLFVLIVFTGFMMSAAHGNPGTPLLGMDRHMLGELHEIGTYLLLGLMMLHLILHAKWLDCMVFGKKDHEGLRRHGGLALMILAGLILVGSVLVPHFLSHHGQERGEGPSRQDGPPSRH